MTKPWFAKRAREIRHQIANVIRVSGRVGWLLIIVGIKSRREGPQTQEKTLQTTKQGNQRPWLRHRVLCAHSTRHSTFKLHQAFHQAPHRRLIRSHSTVTYLPTRACRSVTAPCTAASRSSMLDTRWRTTIVSCRRTATVCNGCSQQRRESKVCKCVRAWVRPSQGLSHGSAQRVNTAHKVVGSVVWTRRCILIH